MPFAGTSRAPTATFAIAIVLTTSPAAHSNALSSDITIVASLVLLQQPILSREHPRRDRNLCCLSPALVLLCGEMAMVTRVHDENSNLLVPRAGSDVVLALLRVVGLRTSACKELCSGGGRGRAAGGGRRGEGRAWVVGGEAMGRVEGHGAEVRTRSKERQALSAVLYDVSRFRIPFRPCTTQARTPRFSRFPFFSSRLSPAYSLRIAATAVPFEWAHTTQAKVRGCAGVLAVTQDVEHGAVGETLQSVCRRSKKEAPCSREFQQASQTRESQHESYVGAQYPHSFSSYR